MKLEIFRRGLQELAFSGDVSAGKFHVAFLAKNGLTFFNAFAVQNEHGISSEQATQCCAVVNEKNETGTLYPKLNITILPLSRYENRDDWDNENSMRKNIEDVLKANSTYIKAQEILFVFEFGWDFNIELAIKVLKKVAFEYRDDQILKHIYYCQ